jgi:four helix bundle protein
MAKDFKDLRVYEQAFEAAIQIQGLSASWPTSEQHAFTDQMRRSSRSVCSSIGDLRLKLRPPNHFISKLSDASSEPAEPIVWLDFAREFGLVDGSTVQHLESEDCRTIGGLIKMTNDPDPWCAPSNRVEDQEAYYDAPPEA